MKEHWNDRYRQVEYAYGKKPNERFKRFLDALNPGRIFLPGDGEGRNAVYAAAQGWSVTAMDQSIEGMRKALALAEEVGVHIDYFLGDISALTPPKIPYDVVSLVFVHLPPEIRAKSHQNLIEMLQPGGIFHIVAFTPEQLKHQTGGPRDLALLYTEDMMIKELGDLQELEIQSIDSVFEEGPYHHGRYKAIEITGRYRG